jgi:hypothetical protein
MTLFYFIIKVLHSKWMTFKWNGMIALIHRVLCLVGVEEVSLCPLVRPHLLCLSLKLGQL